MKNRNLVVKYYKNSELLTTQILEPTLGQSIAVGENTKLTNGFFGADFSYDFKKDVWTLWVDAKKKPASFDKKIRIRKDVSILIEEPPKYKIAPEDIKGTVTKIQVKVVDSSGDYVDSDILPYKRKQKYVFASTKLKITRPEDGKWEKIHTTPKGYSIFTRTIEVPKEDHIVPPAALDSNEKELLKKVAIGYVAVIAFIVITSFMAQLISSWIAPEKKFDVVKIDEKVLEETREKLFKQKEPVRPMEQNKPKVKKVAKAFEKSKKIEKGTAKKHIAKKSTKPSRAGGPKNSKLAVQGIKSNKMAITRGGKAGAKGHFGQKDVTSSKLSKLSKLSGSIGFNSKSSLKASNLYAKGSGGDFSSARKGSAYGKDKGIGIGGGGNGSHGLGSYKVGGLGTLSLGGALKGGGAGAHLSAGKTGKGFVDGLDEEVIVAGGLDASVIKRIIRRNSGDIKYCYERRLNARPNLSGVWEAQFSIGPNGSVQSVRAARDSLSDGTLDSCIRSSIKTWKFPRPVGGTVVNVNYPFILKST